MEIIRLEVGVLRTNCYIAVCPENGRCVIVDPGARAREIAAEIRSRGLTPEAILLTHGHFDHITAVPELREEFRVPVLAGEKERELIKDPVKNLSGMAGRKEKVEPDRFVSDGEELCFSGLKLRVIATPGHTSGSVSYYVPEEEILFSGDTLFENSYGRTDFPTGDPEELLTSICHRLLTLPGETRVLPGHGNATLIGREKGRYPL